MQQQFFLFGARGVGKATLLKSFFGPVHVLTVDLLEPRILAQLQADPGYLEAMIAKGIVAKQLIYLQPSPALLHPF